MKSRRRIATAAFVLVCLALLFVFSDHILFAMGDVLVKSEAPQRADLIVVIGGDWMGNRILKGAELARQGFAPQVLASGPGSLYGNLESDLAVKFAVDHGYPTVSFIPFGYPALSTVDEAEAVIAEIRRRGVHKFLLVTSEFHTARAGRVFRRLGRDLEVHVVAASTPSWDGGHWWTTREGRKFWFNEAIKTIADGLRI